MHLLHCLALAINAEICKSTGTYLLNDKDDHDPYGELDVEFQHAKDKMERYKMDPDRPPRFDVPMPDEDAQVDKEIAPAEDLSEDEANGGSKDEDKGQVNVQSDNKDTPYADKAVEDGQIHRLPLWSMEFVSGPLVPLALSSSTPLSPKAQLQASTSATRINAAAAATAPFPMLKVLPMKPKVKDEPIAPTESPQRRRPIPKPWRMPTPEQGTALASSNKCKVADEGGRGPGQNLPSKKPMFLPSKALQAKSKQVKDNVINLLLSDDNQFVSNYMARKSDDNMASIAFMDLRCKIQRLKDQSASTKSRIRELELQVFKLEQDTQVQECVAAELAKLGQQHLLAASLVCAPAPAPALAPAPASGPAQHHKPLLLSPATLHADPFDPTHPFNQFNVQRMQ
ncbi:hypothetical protein RSOLAG1IB_11469 [Rhizoctonia solani AG-1 IB]|uniref:Uncharacterized protein n=1 Tax=Thanatephorus cucumeris (strain AG1-IB / isolate 7/3/14) TaxID=1108050 RepID=M5CG63_THACB|nr:hypothetical protein BN14_09685 [Rhizoctonia solani AG-1 IB]CEL53733.1 hypothetical protein RSOLAG1IB_11469 [Rhizoctonia solani AG-1 IB]